MELRFDVLIILKYIKTNAKLVSIKEKKRLQVCSNHLLCAPTLWGALVWRGGE